MFATFLMRHSKI